MAKAVVDVLKMVDIHHHECVGMPRFYLHEQRFRSLNERFAVEYTGKVIQTDAAAQAELFALLRVDILQQQKRTHIAGVRIRQHLHAHAHPSVEPFCTQMPVLQRPRLSACEKLGQQPFPRGVTSEARAVVLMRPAFRNIAYDAFHAPLQRFRQSADQAALPCFEMISGQVKL
jgi:hypothetical protein